MKSLYESSAADDKDGPCEAVSDPKSAMRRWPTSCLRLLIS